MTVKELTVKQRIDVLMKIISSIDEMIDLNEVSDQTVNDFIDSIETHINQYILEAKILSGRAKSIENTGRIV